jgi:hypothetical protein
LNFWFAFRDFGTHSLLYNVKNNSLYAAISRNALIAYNEGYLYNMPQAWTSVNPVMLVQLWRKLVPHLENDDLQGFPDEESSKCEILDMVCAMKSFENVNTDNVE